MAPQFWHGINLLPTPFLSIDLTMQLHKIVLEQGELLFRDRRWLFRQFVHLEFDAVHARFEVVPRHRSTDENAEAADDETRIAA